MSENEEKEFRPVYGECPGCGAASNEWCKEDCPLIDPMDMR